MNKINELQKIIDESNSITLFSGAGISTLSGIKDFRSKDGLYSIKYKYDPEILLSSGFFYANTDEFYKFYKDKFNCLNIKPNIIHKYFYKLEKENKLDGIITQNVDGLHTKAGNKKVYELHGSIYRNYCIKCKKEYSAEYVFNSNKTPHCDCGGIIKPDIVLYGEMLNDNTLNNAIKTIQKTETLIVAGSSLMVYPASGLLNYFNGKNLIIINRDKTPFDYTASLVINDELQNVFNKLK